MIRRKHLKSVAKLATKVSPVPVPDIIKDQLDGATDNNTDTTDTADDADTADTAEVVVQNKESDLGLGGNKRMAELVKLIADMENKRLMPKQATDLANYKKELEELRSAKK